MASEAHNRRLSGDAGIIRPSKITKLESKARRVSLAYTEGNARIQTQLHLTNLNQFFAELPATGPLCCSHPI